MKKLFTVIVVALASVTLAHAQFGISHALLWRHFLLPPPAGAPFLPPPCS